MITTAQAEVIYELHEGGWGMDTFTPREAFPGHTNADNARRRTCRTLERKGLLIRVPVPKVEWPYRDHIRDGDQAYCLALADTAMDAFKEYADSVEYEFPWGN